MHDDLSIKGLAERRARSRFGLVHVLFIAAVIILGGFVTIVTSHYAAALTVDYYNQPGYEGPSAVYMTTGVASSYVIPSLSNCASQAASGNMYSVANSICVMAGEDTLSSDLLLNEQYNPNYAGSGQGMLTVNIPMAAAGSQGWWSCGNYLCGMYYQELKVSLTNSPSGSSGTQFQTRYDSGINVDGPTLDGNAITDSYLYKLGMDVAGLVGGTPVGVFQLVNDAVSGREPNSVPGASGNAEANVYFGVHLTTCTSGCGTSGTDGFLSQSYVQVQIPYAEFTTNLPVISISAQNYPGMSCINCYVAGPTASVTMTAFPAVTLTGTLTGVNGKVLANQPVLLSTYSEGPYVGINYHLTTDSNGRYTFFAPLGAPYQLSVGYASSWGAAWAATPWFTTDSVPDIQTVNLQPPVITGQVVYGGTGVGGASVVVTSPSGAQFTATTDSGGHYTVVPAVLGTYTAYADKYGYTKSTPPSTISVTANAIYTQNFGISPVTPGFSLGGCSNLGMTTGTSTTCTVYITSVGGWTSSSGVLLSVSHPSGITDSISPTAVYPGAWQQVTATVTITGSTLGSFTITVTGTGSGAPTQTLSFTVSVTSGGGGGGGGHHCTTICPT